MLLGIRRRGLLRELRRSACVPTRSERTAHSHHAGRRRSAVRRRHDRSTSQSPRLRPGRPSRNGQRSSQHDRRDRPRSRRRGRRAGVRKRFLRLSVGQPGRFDPGLAVLESPQHALGSHGAVDGGHRRRRNAGPSDAGRRTTGRVHLSAGVVAGRCALFRLRPHRVVEPLPSARRPHRGYGAD